MPQQGRTVTRFQELDDGPGTLGAGDDAKFVQWDNGTGALIMAVTAVADTRANILARTGDPTPTFAITTDTASPEFYAWDGADWHKAALQLMIDKDTNDIGAIAFTPDQGYTRFFVHDKLLSSVRFGAWNGDWLTLADGAVQWDGDNLQIRIDDAWKNLIARTDAEIADEVNWSDFGAVAANGNQVIRNHKVDIGALPSDQIFHGGNIP